MTTPNGASPARLAALAALRPESEDLWQALMSAHRHPNPGTDGPTQVLAAVALAFPVTRELIADMLTRLPWDVFVEPRPKPRYPSDGNSPSSSGASAPSSPSTST